MKHPPRHPASRLLRPSVLGAASALLLAACSSGTEPRDDDPLAGLPEAGAIQLELTRAADCDDLLAQVQNTVLAQLEQRAEQLRAGQTGTVYPIGPGSGQGPLPQTDDGVAAPEPGGAPVDNGAADPRPAPPTNTPTAPGGDGNSNPGEDAPEGPGGFSGTTVQVKDVDEADIVKTDGDRIYLLHGGTLFVLNGWPATSTEILGSTLIEGQPSEMFVSEGKAVVFSSVYRDLNAELSQAPASYRSSTYTKLTVLDVSAGTPSALSESYIEGGYVSARRHDRLVRAVVQDGFKVPPLGNPYIEYTDLFGEPYPQADIDAQVDAWLERTIRSVRATELGDWLPREFAREGGEIRAVAPRCGDYYAPDPRLVESGVTSVVSLDLDHLAAGLGGATILGRAERVYANDNAVLVTQSDYRFGWTPELREQTIIHRFDISGAETVYTASGPVPGSVHNQFSLEERDGIVFVSTTERPPWNAGVGIAVDPVPLPTAPVGATMDADVATRPAPVPPSTPQGPINRVLTLRTDGSALVPLGSTEGFGQNEQIFATRFIGDRAYVVTFERTDPLFVVDLADPAHPAVVGELVIPGFSDYLYPLGDDHLFAIGRSATEEGVVQGLALQIFDVSDPTAPALAHRHAYENFGDSPANIDHRAISFHPERGVVAFPYWNYAAGENTLEIFAISAADGFTRLGGMGNANELSFDQCLASYFGYPVGAVPPELVAEVDASPEFQASIRSSCRSSEYFVRGLFRDNFVYGVSNAGVYAYDLDSLAAGAVGQVSLPPQVWDIIGSGVDVAKPPQAQPGEAVPPMGGSSPTPGTSTPVPVDNMAADGDAEQDAKPSP